MTVYPFVFIWFCIFPFFGWRSGVSPQQKCRAIRLLNVFRKVVDKKYLKTGGKKMKAYYLICDVTSIAFTSWPFAHWINTPAHYSPSPGFSLLFEDANVFPYRESSIRLLPLIRTRLASFYFNPPLSGSSLFSSSMVAPSAFTRASVRLHVITFIGHEDQWHLTIDIEEIPPWTMPDKNHVCLPCFASWADCISAKHFQLEENRRNAAGQPRTQERPRGVTGPIANVWPCN